MLTRNVGVQDSRTLLMKAVIRDNAKLAEIVIKGHAKIDRLDTVSKRWPGVSAHQVFRLMK